MSSIAQWRCILSIIAMLLFFFFQAEDGIRDLTVTGVQTCALPISFFEKRCVFVIKAFHFYPRDLLADEPLDRVNMAGVLGGHDGKRVAAGFRPAGDRKSVV